MNRTARRSPSVLSLAATLCAATIEGHISRKQLNAVLETLQDAHMGFQMGADYDLDGNGLKQAQADTLLEMLNHLEDRYPKKGV